MSRRTIQILIERTRIVCVDEDDSDLPTHNEPGTKEEPPPYSGVRELYPKRKQDKKSN
jgi:hypothetical protein